MQRKIGNFRRYPVRRTVGVLSAVTLIWSLLPPLANGIVNVGVVVSFVASLFGLAWGFHTPSGVKLKGWRRTVAMIAWVLVGLVAAVGVVMSAFMLSAAFDKPAAGDGTVIVLGARIHGEYPSRMLGNRLDVAADYLDENPTARCIVSGGLGKGEQYTEAHVMKKYLVEQRGIDPARIYEEGKSTDTHENIQYSMDIIRENGLSERVVIATQEFHQYRASTLAKKAGLTDVSAATCVSPHHLLLCYWGRECGAIARLWVLGY